MGHVRLSRWLNGALGYDPGEMLCARLYRTGGATRLWDALFLVLRGEREHCRAMAAYEAEQRALPERARRAGL